MAGKFPGACCPGRVKVSCQHQKCQQRVAAFCGTTFLYNTLSKLFLETLDYVLANKLSIHSYISVGFHISIELEAKHRTDFLLRQVKSV
jgi:hypothetical protein